MSFLLRASAVIAFIYVYSPVHDSVRDEGGERMALAAPQGTESFARLVDESLYENWNALPQHARDRLTMEIARQLADAASGR